MKPGAIHAARRRARIGPLWVAVLAACSPSRDSGDEVLRAARDISAERIQVLGRRLADDDMAGRYYASPEADSTAALVAATLRAHGIRSTAQSEDLFAAAPVSFSHAFSVTLQRLGPRTRLEQLGAKSPRQAIPERDFAPLLFSRDAEVEGSLVRVRAMELDAPPPRVARRVVLATLPARGSPADARLYAWARRLDAAGALAVLFACPPGGLHSPATTYPSYLPPEQSSALRSSRGETGNLHADRLSQAAQGQAARESPERTLPAFRVRAGWAEELREGDPVRASPGFEPEVSLGQNVLVGFRGRRWPDEVVILGTHYDHIGVNAAGDVLNGADDNASGVAALVEVAIALARVRDQLDRSVLVAFFSAERQGLHGSESLLADLPRLLGTARPVSMLSLRAVGRNDGEPLLLIGGRDEERLAAALLRHDKRERVFGAPLGLQLAVDESTEVARLEVVPSRGSDHLSFARTGVPSVLLTDGLDPLLAGAPDDDWKLVDSEKVARVARLVFHTLLELATAAAAGGTATTASGAQ